MRKQKELVAAGSATQNKNFSGTIAEILTRDGQRRETRQDCEVNLAKGDRLAREVGDLYKQGKRV